MAKNASLSLYNSVHDTACFACPTNGGSLSADTRFGFTFTTYTPAVGYLGIIVKVCDP